MLKLDNGVTVLRASLLNDYGLVLARTSSHFVTWCVEYEEATGTWATWAGRYFSTSSRAVRDYKNRVRMTIGRE